MLFVPISSNSRKAFYNLPPQEHLFFSTVYHDKVNFSTSLTSFSQIFLWEGLFFNLRSPHILYRRFQAADNYLIVSAVFMFIPQISCALFIIRTYSAAMHSDSFRSRAGMNILWRHRGRISLSSSQHLGGGTPASAIDVDHSLCTFPWNRICRTGHETEQKLAWSSDAHQQQGACSNEKTHR